MLRELEIRNFALIEHVHVQFGDGLNVLSGETGAGKSILLLALQLVLGAKSQSKFLRSGANQWEVQALFDSQKLKPDIRSQLPDIARESDELAIFRSGNAQGKGKVYINGILASLSVLQDISSRLIAICSQSEHLALLHPQYHLALLDSYGQHDEVLRLYRESFERCEEMRKKIHALKDKSVSLERRKLELEDLLRELQAIPLRAGLRQAWEAEIQRLSSAEQLTAHCQALEDLFLDETGIEERLRAVFSVVQALIKLDPGIVHVKSLFDNMQTHAQELLMEVQRYARNIDIDGEALESRREQLSQLARLERKYGKNDEALAVFQKEAEQELFESEGVMQLEQLEAEYEKARQGLETFAKDLRKKRINTARKLETMVQGELHDVNMGDAICEVAFEEKGYQADGGDAIEFLLSANKGEPARPLHQVASGGELSRMTLVLKKILQDQSSVNVLVFDEIDTGISGAVARAVGMKLRALASGSQVLCISHLAQVASLADVHFLVEKTSGSRTSTSIRQLSDPERVEEIARMLSGARITEASRESAQELLSGRDGVLATL